MSKNCTFSDPNISDVFCIHLVLYFTATTALWLLNSLGSLMYDPELSLLLAYRRAKPALKAGQLFFWGSGLVTMSDIVSVRVLERSVKK